MEYLWVGLGGLLGALARYLAGRLAVTWPGTGFPWGTILINVTGSLLLGAIQVLAVERLTFSTRFRLLAGVGFCGAFTTFSTFTRESLALLQHNPPGGILYLGASPALCLLGTWLGMASARSFWLYRSNQGKQLPERE